MRIVFIIALMLSMPVVRVGTVAYQSDCSPKDNVSQSSKLVSQETYNQVLDILFPRDEPAGNYYLVLRFKPSSHPESQIVIKRGLNKAEVIEYTSLGESIYSKLAELTAIGEREDARELAKLFKVRKRSIPVPYTQVKQWHTSFVDSLRESLRAFQQESQAFDKTGSMSAVIDGTLYDLWYSQGLNELSFSFYDEEISTRQPNGVLKAVRWMNFIRSDVERLK